MLIKVLNRIIPLDRKIMERIIERSQKWIHEHLAEYILVWVDVGQIRCEGKFF